MAYTVAKSVSGFGQRILSGAVYAVVKYARPRSVSHIFVPDKISRAHSLKERFILDRSFRDHAKAGAPWWTGVLQQRPGRRGRAKMGHSPMHQVPRPPGWLPRQPG